MEIPERNPCCTSELEYRDTDKVYERVGKTLPWLLADGIIVYNDPQTGNTMARLNKQAKLLAKE